MAWYLDADWDWLPVDKLSNVLWQFSVALDERAYAAGLDDLIWEDVSNLRTLRNAEAWGWLPVSAIAGRVEELRGIVEYFCDLTGLYWLSFPEEARIKFVKDDFATPWTAADLIAAAGYGSEWIPITTAMDVSEQSIYQQLRAVIELLRYVERMDFLLVSETPPKQFTVWPAVDGDVFTATWTGTPVRLRALVTPGPVWTELDPALLNTMPFAPGDNVVTYPMGIDIWRGDMKGVRRLNVGEELTYG